MALYLQTAMDAGYRAVALMPGAPGAAPPHPPIQHISLTPPNAMLWYGGGGGNALRAIGRRLRVCGEMAMGLVRLKPDACISVGPDAWLVAVATKPFWRGRVVNAMHETYEDRALAFPRFVQAFTRWAIRAAMRVMSRYTDELIHVSTERQQHYAFLSRRGVVLTPFPDLATFHRALTSHPESARPLPAHPTVTVVHAGSLTPTYASEELLEAIRLVRERRRDVRFVVIGGVAGPLRNAALISELVADGVLSMTPRVPFDEVVRILTQSEIGLSLVLPVDTGHYLAQPRKLYEYLAAGLPVIAADVPTLRNVVTRWECGQLVDPYSAASIADAICALADDPARRRTLGANARRASELCFNWDLERRKFDCLLSNVAAPQRRAHLPQ